MRFERAKLARLENGVQSDSEYESEEVVSEVRWEVGFHPVLPSSGRLIVRFDRNGPAFLK